MFTGLVEEVGKISKIEKTSTGEYLIQVKCSLISPQKLSIGESVAVNGICLTVVNKSKGSFKTLASKETLSRSNLSNKVKGSYVNLERAMKAESRFGGHIVSGHIDTTAKVKSVYEAGKSNEYWFEIKKKFGKYIIEKGSVAIDGISLTINEVNSTSFSVNIIPHTSDNTLSNTWKKDVLVNLEFDMIGKYIERLIKK
tara:strand:+ start:686 stop:1279 length:594 start_codon:yes stop_codon:yes gene_type:complete